MHSSRVHMCVRALTQTHTQALHAHGSRGSGREEKGAERPVAGLAALYFFEDDVRLKVTDVTAMPGRSKPAAAALFQMVCVDKG